MLPLGKLVADKLYIHVSALDRLGGAAAVLLADAQEISKCSVDRDFNVIRIRIGRDEVALLNYPRFFEDAFPALLQSWRVHVPSRSVAFRDYSQSLNPPILHRKELLLASDHPDSGPFATVTAFAESIGLFDDPQRIGFLIPWTELVARKGYRVDGRDLLPIGNAEPAFHGITSAANETLVEIQRHLTALARTSLSAPVQSLLHHELLRSDTSFFDYGCGKGGDLSTLHSLGIPGVGWDPHYRPNVELAESDIVNIGFVINVIEDFGERVEALTGAYKLCRQVLAVSAMLQSAGYTGRAFRDGVLTGRNTFQKYYSQAELQQFIESVLDESATPAGPGVFYVFKDPAVEHNFHARRSVSRTRALRAILLPRLPRQPRPVRLAGSLRQTAHSRREDPERLGLAAQLWRQCLDLGRKPDMEEVVERELLLTLFGSLGRALAYCLRRNDVAALERSAAARRDELRVFFALQLFSRRRRFLDFDRRLQRDVKVFFGSLANAEAEGRQLLYSTRDVDQIARACEQASALGLGWLEPGHALHLHSSAVERLPAILRVYVGCATIMYGDIAQMDLVKLHLLSGKVSVMRFDDFVGSPLPAMVERVKVRLRDQEFDVFRYGGDFPPPLLYRKSRFINEEFPHYAEQLNFDGTLEELGLFDLSGFGPEASAFRKALSDARWVVSGYNLERSRSMPSLDDRCSEHFTYRQLIECGDTWQETHVANVPSQPETFAAITDLSRMILEPVVEYFGGIRLTYGFCSRHLAKLIHAGRRGIEPRIDQHASHELNTKGDRICMRGGAAVDFVVDDENMREVADWIATNLPFDRLYYYGPSRPIHVSYGSQQSRTYIDIEERDGRRLPKRARMPASKSQIG